MLISLGNVSNLLFFDGFVVLLFGDRASDNHRRVFYSIFSRKFAANNFSLLFIPHVARFNDREFPNLFFILVEEDERRGSSSR